MTDFGKSLLIANNSLIFEMKVLHSKHIGKCIVNVRGKNIAYSSSEILLL